MAKKDKKGDKSKGPKIPTKQELRTRMIGVFTMHKVGLCSGDEVYMELHRLLAGVGARLATDEDTKGLDVIVRAMAVTLGAVLEDDDRNQNRLNDLVVKFARDVADADGKAKAAERN